MKKNDNSRKIKPILVTLIQNETLNNCSVYKDNTQIRLLS